MHWVFYVIAAAVTALAIYVQMKRVDKGSQEDEKSPDKDPSAGKRKSKKRK